MSTFISVIFAIFLFSFLIFVHELGHFLTAKAFKVRVKTSKSTDNKLDSDKYFKLL